MFKCSGHIVLEETGDATILCADRVAMTQYAALDLVLTDLMKQLSLQNLPRAAEKSDVMVMVWVDAIMGADAREQAERMQKLLDHGIRNEER